MFAAGFILLFLFLMVGLAAALIPSFRMWLGRNFFTIFYAAYSLFVLYIISQILSICWPAIRYILNIPIRMYRELRYIKRNWKPKKCPICGVRTTSKMKCKHYFRFDSDLFAFRIAAFKYAVAEIAEVVRIDFWDKPEVMSKKYGFVMVGEIKYADDPVCVLRKMLDSLFIQAMNQIASTCLRKEIVKIYEMSIAGEESVYRLKDNEYAFIKEPKLQEIAKKYPPIKIKI